MSLKSIVQPLVAALLCLPTLAKADALFNAASPTYGPTLSIVAGDGAKVDQVTTIGMSFDGNLHTRQVVSAVPYTIKIELADTMEIDKVTLAQCDWKDECAPKEIELELDDGTKIPYTLELSRPEKGKAVWQEVPIGKTSRIIRLTVKSNYQPNPKINWGGIGEIAVMTPENLAQKFAVPGYDEKAQVFVDKPVSHIGDGPDIAVNLPPVAAAGEHPRLLMTKTEAAELSAAMDGSDEGKKTKATLITLSDAAAHASIDFPDPAGALSQLKDRNDATAKKHDSLAAAAGNLGIAYTLTGEKRYADKAAEILKGYADRYAQYPDHKGANPNDTGKVMAQRLSEAMWIIPLIESYDYIHDSGSLSDGDRKHIENDLIRPAIAFIRKKSPADEAAARTARAADWRTAMPTPGDGKPVGNWLLFYNAATMMAGSTLADQDMIDLATADFKTLLRKGIGSDGMWGEGAIGYQFFAINALISGVESAARQGVDLYSFDHCRLKMMFDSPLRYAYPDATAPGINDSGRVTLGDWTTMCYDYAWLRYRDPAYAALVSVSPRQAHFSTAIYYPTRVYDKPAAIGTKPSAAESSAVFDNLGYAILRNGQTYALLKYGQHGGVHGHYDKLNLILFATGDDGRADEIGGEPKFHKYEDVLHNEWTSTSIAHNTMTVNQRSQGATEGKLLCFLSRPEMSIARGEAAGAYPGALLDRTVVQLPGLILDCYTGRSAIEKTWDRTFRYQGTLAGLGTDSAKPLGQLDGYQHFLTGAAIDAAGGWKGQWQTKVGAFTVALAGAAGQRVFTGTGPDRDQLAIARQLGKTAAFGAAYQMGAWGDAVDSITWLPAEGEIHALSVKQHDGDETLLIIGDGKPFTAGGWSSDARVLCIRTKNGTAAGASQVMLLGGTTAQGPAGKISLPAAANAFATGIGGNLVIQK